MYMHVSSSPEGSQVLRECRVGFVEGVVEPGPVVVGGVVVGSMVIRPVV